MHKQPSPPYLQNVESGLRYELKGRIVTIGASQDCTIRLPSAVAARCAHCLFIGGGYHFQQLTEEVQVLLNGHPVEGMKMLVAGDRVMIGETQLQFGGSEDNELMGGHALPDMTDELLTVVLMLLRNRDGDIAPGLLSAIARLLRCDAARIVGEDADGTKRRTLVRYPENTGLDRFSNRAIDWAKDASHTVLVLDSDWAEESTDNRSLEKNSVASVLCAPLRDGERSRGYLYIDRIRKDDRFTEADRLLCDRLLPLFIELLANSEERRRQTEMIAALQNAQERGDGGIIYRSERMRTTLLLAERIAPSDGSVLISGETGTGKELLARYIHVRSSRSTKPFKAINCGAIPENLIESELFGHEKGAFTGAHARKAGLFEAADGGSVFLDEIGEMPLQLQVKLLRVLQEGEVTRLGAIDPVGIDVRIIAATNRELRNEISRGRFRSDLFFRLNVLTIALPPLRERSEDILLLAEYFIGKYCSRMGREQKTLSADAQVELLSHVWPGNVRELENVIQKAVIVSAGRKIEKEEIEIFRDQEEDSTLRKTGRTLTLKDAREAAETECIRTVLQTTRGNVSQTSRLLAIDRKWLFTKMMEYGINAGEYRDEATGRDVGAH